MAPEPVLAVAVLPDLPLEVPPEALLPVEPLSADVLSAGAVLCADV